MRAYGGTYREAGPPPLPHGPWECTLEEYAGPRPSDPAELRAWDRRRAEHRTLVLGALNNGKRLPPAVTDPHGFTATTLPRPAPRAALDSATVARYTGG